MHFLKQTKRVGQRVSTNKVVLKCNDVNELISIWDKHPNSPVVTREQKLYRYLQGYL